MFLSCPRLKYICFTYSRGLKKKKKTLILISKWKVSIGDLTYTSLFMIILTKLNVNPFLSLRHKRSFISVEFPTVSQHIVMKMIPAYHDSQISILIFHIEAGLPVATSFVR